MRWLSFLLATYVCFLAVRPAIDKLSFNGPVGVEICTASKCCSGPISCCDQTDESGDRHSNKGCTNGLCNPFEQCSYCSFLISREATFELTRSIILKEFPGTTSDHIISNYTSDYFHPPEIV